jgi:hypothetical protein
MKKHFITLCLLGLAIQFTAHSLHDQLVAFNPNWKKYGDRLECSPEIQFKSDAALIQAHLVNVLHILHTNNTSHLTEDQLKSRDFMILNLENYCNDGNFPINREFLRRTPIFIDHNDTHCAVAYLLKQSGYEELARNIAREDNPGWLPFDKLQTDKNKHLLHELAQWQNSSGLTMEEVRLIQGAYDFYDENAFVALNRYELPQKPSCMVAYFDGRRGGKGNDYSEHNIWCKGEGKDGILHGKWIQNYTSELPWIVGYYNEGKRTGQWQEYYQGTNQLCRTENWRNDQLNGVRKRFSREGKLIEEILFVNGVAAEKTNYDLEKSLTWVRKPIDGEVVSTEVFTMDGRLLAKGIERIFNPGNLSWFQNIELTALNTAAITARDNQAGSFMLQYGSRSKGLGGLFNTLPLVQYHKEGNWIYYNEFSEAGFKENDDALIGAGLVNDFPHLSDVLLQDISLINKAVHHRFDSLQIAYEQNRLTDFIGSNANDYIHFHVSHHSSTFVTEQVNNYYSNFQTNPIILPSAYGQFNRNGEKIGEWSYIDSSGLLYKTENFILPEKKEHIVIEKK